MLHQPLQLVFPLLIFGPRVKQVFCERNVDLELDIVIVIRTSWQALVILDDEVIVVVVLVDEGLGETLW